MRIRKNADKYTLNELARSSHTRTSHTNTTHTSSHFSIKQVEFIIYIHLAYNNVCLCDVFYIALCSTIAALYRLLYVIYIDLYIANGAGIVHLCLLYAFIYFNATYFWCHNSRDTLAIWNTRRNKRKTLMNQPNKNEIQKKKRIIILRHKLNSTSRQKRGMAAQNATHKVNVLKLFLIIFNLIKKN